jgi:hypothetical protein
MVWNIAGAAQEADRLLIQSRAEQIQAERQLKARNLEPDQPDRIERGLQFIKEKKIVERITGGVAGVRVSLGGLVTGSGFAAGPEYLRRDLAGERIIFRSSVRASLREAYLIDTQLSMPRLANDRLFVDLYAAHRNLPRIDYYGPGPSSAKSGRTAYGLEDTTFQAETGVRPAGPLRLGVVGRYVLLNVGPGRDARFASTDRVFSPAQAPGIQRQSDYWERGAFVQLDFRDNPGGPRSGGNYVAELARVSDRGLGLYSFDRLNLEAQQYISFFNERRVIALRARGSFTDPRPGNVVPFYLQPSLGGSDDLRGFRPFRFYDNNAVVFNGEYRWEVFSGMDAALFADAGRVFRHWRDAELADLETSYGFGLRFNVRNDVFLRIDTGFSREGFQVWFKFGNAF